MQNGDCSWKTSVTGGAIRLTSSHSEHQSLASGIVLALNQGTGDRIQYNNKQEIPQRRLFHKEMHVRHRFQVLGDQQTLHTTTTALMCACWIEVCSGEDAFH